MKKITATFIAIILSLWHFQTLAASGSTDITLQAEQPDEHKVPLKGHRMPSTQYICTIDFNNYRIETTIPYDIIAYELWNEDGAGMSASYSTDYEIVEFMDGLSGEYQLRIVTTQHAYTGYLELQ